MVAGGQVEVRVVADTAGFGDDLKSKLDGVGSAAESVGRGLGLALAAGAAVGGAGLAAVISIGSTFEDTLAKIGSQSGATAAQLEQVSKTAIALGSDTQLAGVSAQDAASSILELSKSGLSLADSQSAAKSALVLASAAQIDGADAASLLANTLNQYGLAAGDAAKVTDILAAGASASTTDITGLGEALKYSATPAAALGVSLRDTVAATALLSNAGLDAGQAGTTLRSVLVSLANPSKQAAQGLKTLGVDAFDAQGKFVGFPVLIDELSQAQGRLTDQQFAQASASAFGSEALSGVLALAAAGPAKFDAMTVAVDKSGVALSQASATANTFNGQIGAVQSNLETLAVVVYDKIEPGLKAVASAAAGASSSLLDAVSSFDPTKIVGFNTAADAARGFLDDLATAGGNLLTALKPVGDGFTDVYRELDKSSGIVPPSLKGSPSSVVRLWWRPTRLLRWVHWSGVRCRSSQLFRVRCKQRFSRFLDSRSSRVYLVE